MAKRDKEYEARMQGMLYSVNVVKESGLEALEKDINKRGVLKAPLAYTDKQIEDFDLVEVIPTTICQYTGLTDKNGKRIWENDIVRNEKGDIGVVQWFEEHAAFMIWNKTKHYVCYLAENDFSKIEIAGNEFDNPELLEVE